jgi:hypothetical protein
MNVNINPITNLPGKSYDYVNNVGANPIVLAILVLVLIVYYALFSSISSDRPSLAGTTMPSYGILETLLWGVFIALLLLNAITYFYSLELDATINNLFGEKPELDINVTGPGVDTSVPEIKIQKQVFHVPGNTLDYSNAKAVCKAYGANLATYNQIEKAYDKGGEWCSYGWSENQLALFPTQKKSYEKLQKTAGHENDCGRPGINGGYIDNPNIKFGVNCFGYKPKITADEKQDMAVNNLYPKSKSEILFEKQVDKWKNKLPQVQVAPFNRQTWSRV